MRFPELAVEFGRRIKDIRMGMNKSVADFAIHCHIDITCMYAIEAGHQFPALFSVIKICHYTQTPFAVLLHGLEELIDDKYDSKKVK